MSAREQEIIIVRSPIMCWTKIQTQCRTGFSFCSRRLPDECRAFWGKREMGNDQGTFLMWSIVIVKKRSKKERERRQKLLPSL